MKGWLVVNSFIESAKFTDIYNYLKNSASNEGAELKIITSDRFAVPVQDGLAGLVPPDFVIFWDKDVLLAKRLENLGLKVFNSAEAIKNCDNKILTAITLSENRIPSPKTVPVPKTFEAYGYTNFDFLEKAGNILGYPLVIKEAYGSFGMQVHLAESKKAAEEIIKGTGSKDILLQEYISESSGRDLRVNVVGGNAVCCMERTNKNDFRSNITIGGVMKRHVLSKEEAALATSAAKAIGLDFAGVDILFGKNGPLVCEVNSNPHFKSTLECTGVDISRAILRHVIASVSGK